MTEEEAYRIINKNLPQKKYYCYNIGTECEMLTKNREKAINRFLEGLRNNIEIEEKGIIPDETMDK